MYDVDEFVNKVLEGNRTAEENKKALIRVLDPAAASVLKRLNISDLEKDFEETLWELFQCDTPPSSTKLIHFGVRETADGCNLYVVGTRQKEPPEFRDTEEWDWVGPHNGVLKLPILSVLWENLGGGKEEEWEVVLAVVMILLKSYLSKNTESFLDITGLSRVKITAGFDDGDLYEIPLE